MGTKYYSGSPVTGKQMDGFSFVFESISVRSGGWRGAYTTESKEEQAALAKLQDAGQIKEISEETYNDFQKKKAERVGSSPNLNAVSEQQAVDHAAPQVPKASVEDEEDILEVKQIAKPKRKSKKG
jgi:hypothetical protein